MICRHAISEHSLDVWSHELVQEDQSPICHFLRKVLILFGIWRGISD
jgi:hypothetical protein